MIIEIEGPNLAFLIGELKLPHDVPISVVRAARLKLNIIKAVPKPEYMSNWKSLDFKTQNESNTECSISISEDWRMDLCSDSNKEPPLITVKDLRRV